MRFLVDAQLPPALCRWLEARGHAAEHVADVGLLAASDAEIAGRAQAIEAILVSKDEDFVVLRMPTALPSYGCGAGTRPTGRSAYGLRRDGRG